MEPQFKLIIDKWVHGKLHREELDFYFYEDVIQHAYRLDEYDFIKVHDVFGVVIYEDKFKEKKHRHKPPFNDHHPDGDHDEDDEDTYA